MKYLCLFSFCFLHLTLSSQSNVTVEVFVTNQYGKPLEKAHVYINNSVLLTDSSGFVAIKNIEKSELKLKVSYIGFGTQERLLSLKDSTNKITSIFKLSPLSVQLGEWIVVEKYIEDSIRYRMIHTYMIDKKTISKLPNTSSLMDLVYYVNGINETVACGVCGTNSISTRGLPGSHTLLLIDGIPVYGSLAATYSLNGIPVTMIESVEVTKGSHSALYGSGAVAGVVNVTTKKNEDMPMFSVNTNYNSLKQKDINFSSGYENYVIKFMLGISSGSAHHFADKNHDGFGDNINFSKYNLFSKLSVKRKSKKQFEFFAKYLLEDRRNGVEAYLQNNAYSYLRGSDFIYGESIYTNRFEISGIYQFPFSFYSSVDFSFSSHAQDSYYGNYFFYAKQNMFTLNSIEKIKYKKSIFKYGKSIRISYYDDNTFLTKKRINSTELNEPVYIVNPALFIQNDLLLSDKISFLMGARADFYKTHKFIYSSQFNLKYSPFIMLDIRLHAGTGFNVVNLFAEEHAFVNGQRKLLLTDNLLPEKARTISLSSTYYYKLFKNINQFEIDFYSTSFSQKILPDYSQPGLVIYSNTKNKVFSKGVEINVNQKVADILEFNAGGNFQNVFEYNADSLGKKVLSYLPYSTKFNTQFICILYLFNKKINVSYTWKYTGTTQMPEVYNVSNEGVILNKRNETAPAFHLHNVECKYNYSKQGQFYFGVKNIFHFFPSDSPISGFNDKNYPAGFSPFFDTSYNYAPLAGRMFYLGVKWNLDKIKK
ncbi:MAG: TonB-dependent receptor plug domain-containing protein [Flavobacteriales bacterium]|nr:TonB-dependent receptor plug domain-containing protein [Flavobacteriales bacterium]